MGNKRHLIGPEHPLYATGKSIDSMGYVVLTSKIHGADVGRREHRVVTERDPESYQCRPCRFGRTWNNARSK